MNRRRFLARVAGVTGAGVIAAGCQVGPSEPDVSVVEAIDPRCVHCNEMLALPAHWRTLSPQARLLPLVSGTPCRCGVTRTALFFRRIG
jgi:hypothetical protein